MGDATRDKAEPEAQHRSKWVAVAGFFCHAPGLWLFFRLTLGETSKRHNVHAVFATLASMALAYWLTTSGSAVFIVWLIGHFLWGGWLAHRIQRDLLKM